MPPGQDGRSRGGLGAGRLPVGPSVFRVALVLALAFGGVMAGAGYWQVLQAARLSTAPDNPAVAQASLNAIRGRILDRSGRVLAVTARTAAGKPYRVYSSTALSPVLGYASQLYGSSGLERADAGLLLGVGRADPAAELLRKFDPNPYDPADLTLGISLPLQQRAVSLLGKDRGAVVMLDPQTGQILAMASTPTYDASAIANPATSKAAFTATSADPGDPLLDRAVQGLYVPGSILKIVTTIAGIGSGTLSPSTTYPQQPAAETTGLLVDGYRVQDGHHPWTDGTALDLAGAIENSCNIYFALTGLRVGGQNLTDWADRLGFDAPIPFDLPTAVSQLTNGGGPLPGGFADDVELANAAYGQAETLVTPLQMALVAATVGNDGTLMQPHLVISVSSAKAGTQPVASQVWRQVLSPQQTAPIKADMEQAVEGQYGRLFTTGAQVPGVPTAGKSGTAQLGGQGEPNSWFIGFAPVDHPRIAIAVVVEQGGSGALRASPLAGNLMTYYLQQIAPSVQEAP